MWSSSMAVVAASEPVRHPLHAAQPAAAPDEMLLAVEIPAGSSIKYEIGGDGLIRVDRFLSMPMAYPANYGSIPRTLGGDGDPLDALVLTRVPLHPGTLIAFRPIGYLKMLDGGERDEKIIGVPTERIDPSYADIRDLSDLPEIERRRIEAFFRVYKDLAQGGNLVQLEGFANALEARSLIERSLQSFSRAAVD
ncbi:inorganic diphosphatase [Marilutibacter alkalisoli]|uniref:Inorganic pyrophosphatase n=1 Tax=Marilutibacter alkalisoli TaxID=2591633 RepID=A0A514BWG2_9GAMM|nr:inorganic diphosphatase [Lysobacter alkalisoli]QDH71720.1 inorganic diphosphatase [Lysobacter alkalisoli]